MKDSFSAYHPIVSFGYFTAVLLFSMFVMHPVFIVISIIGAGSYCIYQSGRGGVRFGLMYLLPVAAVTALFNPVFNHQGITILRYLPNGNPLTLESILYGIGAGGLLCCVVLWFSCFNKVITSDKFMYFFGRIMPSLSLVLSMTIRFVPRFKNQFVKVRQAQKSVGRDVSEGGIIQRMKNLAAVFSVMISWTLENSIITADSMRSRGYGLKGRTAYTLYRFEKRDIAALSAVAALSVYVAAGISRGAVTFRFYPMIYFKDLSAYGISIYAAYFLLCMLPTIINVREDVKWKCLRQKI